MINIVESTNFRIDGVKILIRTAKAYVDKVTRELFSEIPEGREATEFGELTGRVRNDQTGAIYEIAHDVEDASYTYTELYPSPESFSELNFVNYGSGYDVASPNFKEFPAFRAATTYNEGDIATSGRYEWISEFDDNTGNTPTNLWGWSVYRPFIADREVIWQTIEEIGHY